MKEAKKCGTFLTINTGASNMKKDAGKKVKDISYDSAMKKLKKLYNDMHPEEKEHERGHLKRKAANKE